MYLFVIFIPLFLSFLLANFLPYQSIVYQEFVNLFATPFFSRLANFDGIHYITISKDSYVQFQQAFFPLYPLLIKIFTKYTHNYFTSGLIISNLSYFSALCILSTNFIKFKYKNYQYFLLFLISFPASFYFHTVYSESLFLLLLVIYASLVYQKKYLLASIPALFLSLTRITGIFTLIFPVLYLLKTKKFSLPVIALIIAPILGLSLFSTYLYKTTGDPLFFLHSQSAFGANRTSSLVLSPQVLYRYLKIFLTFKFNSSYWVAILELTSFSSVFLVLVYQLVKLFKAKFANIFLLSLNLFSFSVIVLPTLTGTLSSLPRYILLAPAIYFYLADLKNSSHKNLILSIFFILKVYLFALFLQGHFIA